MQQTAIAPPCAEVCVLTARGMAAIATVALAGPGAEAVLKRLFSRPVPACGHSSVGTIRDGDTVVDGVVAACEAPERFVIHCHGNPLLVERIVRLCEQFGAISRQAGEFLYAQLRDECTSRIEAEARLEMTRAATLEGVKLLAAQMAGGLSAWGMRWKKEKTIDIHLLHRECREILQRSHLADRILRGVKIALAGPPNSGKSTLFNWLAQDTAALVADTAGTTRDWVSTVCRIGPLRAEVIDTAGIDPILAQGNALDQAAQVAAIRAMGHCDLILAVRDCTQPASEMSLPPGIPVLTVLTKIDLLPESSASSLGDGIAVSVPAGHGLNALYAGIMSALEVDSFCYDWPIAFTLRQRNSVKAVLEASTPEAAQTILMSLVQ